MTNKRPLHLFLGIILIFLAALLGLAVVKVTLNFIRDPGRFSTPWLLGEQILRIGWGLSVSG
jgi:hypothetical protein